MKTTVELPDALYRQAKAEAALRGRKFKDLVEKGLRLVPEAPSDTTRHPDLAGLMRHALGVVASGVPDLGSNHEQLKGFARCQPSLTRAAGCLLRSIGTISSLGCRASRGTRRPLLVCEPALTEAAYLLARFPMAQDALFGLLQNGAACWRFDWKSTSAHYTDFCENTPTHRCLWPMPASFAWPRFMRIIPS
jgi:hypothetical protein